MWYEKLQRLEWWDALLLIGGMLVTAGLGLSIRDSLDSKAEVTWERKVTPTIVVQVSKEVMFDIEGAVIHPGVYKLAGGSRINDALAKAGGLSAEADRSWVEVNINLAEMVKDGMKIVIPRKNETLLINDNKVIEKEKVMGVETKSMISLNSAGIEELDRLPGVGPAIAQKIIDYRQENGGFRNVEEIKLVSGVGEKMFEKIKDLIEL